MYLISNIFIESEILNLTGMHSILRIVKYISILICVLSCHDNLWLNKKRTVYFWGILLLSGLNMLLVEGGSGFIEIIIVVLCFTLNKTKVSHIFKCCINTLFIGHLFIIFLSHVGVLKDEISSRYFGNYMGSFFAGEYVRHQMGFLASNQVPLTLMIVYFMLIAYKQKEVKICEHIMFLIVNFWCFFNFGARVSFILIIATLFGYEFISFMNKVSGKYLRIHIMWLAYIVCAVVSVFSACMYNVSSHIWVIANEIFYNRIKWSHAAIERYGVSLIGYGLNAGEATGAYGENLIDNGYVLLLIQKGVLIGIFVIAFWCLLAYKAEKKNNSYMVLSLVMVAVASLIDSHLVSYKMIPFYCVLTLGDYMIHKNDEYCRGVKQ